MSTVRVMVVDDSVVVCRRGILRRVRQVIAHGYRFLGAAETTLRVDDAWKRVAAGRSSVYRIRAGAG